CSSSEVSEQQRQDDTHDDGAGEREVEAEVPPLDVEVARQPPDRDTHHDEETEAGDDETHDDQRLAHDLSWSAWWRRDAQTSSTPAKKYPISYTAVSGASDPCVALRSIDCPNSWRRVPASALAGSVAPISVRHFLIASGASSTRTMAGPDDMNVVRLPKNPLPRCTA